MENNSTINNENSSMTTLRALLVATLLAIGAPLANADGSDPLDPSDGGADWDGDGLTNSEEQSQGTNRKICPQSSQPTLPRRTGFPVDRT